MKPSFTITTLEQLRALANPLRLQILKHITAQPMTMAQVGEAMGIAPNKLYYHIGEMEREGLVEVVETRTRGNLLEKHYQAVSEQFQVDKSLFRTGGPAGMELFYESITTSLDATAQDVREAITTGRLTSEEAERTRTVYTDVRLAPARMAEFQGKLQRLLEEYTSPEPEAAAFANLLLVLYPLKEPLTP